MTKRTVLTTLIIPIGLISGLIIVLINNPPNAAPELILGQQDIHFGTLPEWEGPVTRSVTAQNRGRAALHIQNVRTGCSYVEITGPTVLPPKTEGTFYIVINPEILPTHETSVTTVTIFTDSPKTPVVALTVIAAAKRFATLRPDVCEFGDILPETTHQRTLTLAVNAPMDTAGIRLLPSNHQKLAWELSPDTARITVKLDQLKNKGRFSSLLTVAFPNGRTLTLPVTARVVAPVQIK